MMRKQLHNRSANALAMLCLGLSMLALPAHARQAADLEQWGPMRHFRGALVTGTIELNGCRVSPRELRLQADPLTPVADGAAIRPDRHVRSRQAVIMRTRNPNLFRFIVAGLDREGLYRLSIGAPPNPCGKVFWRGPFEGLVTAGTRAVSIEGFSATTEIEVFDVEVDEWVGATTMSLADTAAGGTLKRLRWRSRLEGVEAGELQISASAFPTEGDFGACDEPASGIVLRAEVPFEPDGWAELGEFDFASLFGRIYDPPDDGILASLAVDSSRAEDDSDTGNNDVVPLSELDELLVNMGAPFYLRVVPQRADGAACDRRRDGLAGWVMVADDVGRRFTEFPPPPPPQAPVEFGDGHYYHPPFFATVAGQLVPNYQQQAFAVTRKHPVPTFPSVLCDSLIGDQFDPLGCWIRNQGLAPAGSMIEPPFRFLYVQQSSGGGSNPLSALASSLGNLVTGLVTIVSYGIDAAARAIEDIKNAVTGLALQFLSVPPFGAACNALGGGPVSCEDIVRTGIAVGLTSMGLPPSLPNFEQLKNQGVEYLAAQIQSQTGVPQVLADEALQIAKNKLEEMAAKSGGSDERFNWVTPWLGTDPAYAEIVVRKNVPDPTDGGLILVRQDSDQFVGGAHSIPAVFPPSRELRIPMVLHMNVKGILNPLCQIDPFGISCTPNLFATRPVCQFGYIKPASGGQIEYTDADCNSYTAPNIYFRDEWFRQRFENTPCTNITLKSARSSGLGPVPPPPGFGMLMARGMDPHQPSNWNGSFSFDCFVS